MGESHGSTPESAWLQSLTAQCGRTPTEGVVLSVLPFGAFVHLAEGVDGILHLCERAREPQPGEIATVRVRERRGRRTPSGTGHRSGDSATHGHRDEHAVRQAAYGDSKAGAFNARIGGPSVVAPCLRPISSSTDSSGAPPLATMWAACSANMSSIPPGTARAMT